LAKSAFGTVVSVPSNARMRVERGPIASTEPLPSLYWMKSPTRNGRSAKIETPPFATRGQVP
jgi:hypothetical protein